MISMRCLPVALVHPITCAKAASCSSPPPYTLLPQFDHGHPYVDMDAILQCGPYGRALVSDRTLD
jgi:hypothetical protein